MARTRSAKKPKKRTGSRPSWRGDLVVGLVSFAVEAINVLNRQGSDIHFHQLHGECHSRIQYQKVCPKHGPVSNDEIVSGYEVRKGEYVEVEPSELDALRTKRERALRVDSFVAPDAIDPVYFDGRMYYLAPASESSQEPFAVLLMAMRQEERSAVGRIVLSGKEQPVLIRPLGDTLHMAMLNFMPEIKPVESTAVAIPKSGAVSRQLRLARTLVREWSDEDFDFSAYEDDYREKLKGLIRLKVQGQEIVGPPEEEEEPEVVNLLDALRKSLDKTKLAKDAARRPRAATRRSRAKKRVRKTA